MTSRKQDKQSFEPGIVPAPGGLLDWRDSRHFDSRQDRPCTVCLQPTPMRAHSGEAVHKVCAEAWIAANPVEARLGRFANDLQVKRRHDGVHA
ncbi:hypothetical protein OG897_40165 [Streptomyces sp. NBC_00237]|uniref:hypothetical protein n=1 Tax=Streptomyces sp. NBC_00237 TaxID=2975687 RepID=UPI0022527AE8|nr:hypothetical protein [Streptomyces sp. NBC_00237]MCX5207608.1 hypothetical protein [Streptomyces sp. NBC_00237]